MKDLDRLIQAVDDYYVNSNEDDYIVHCGSGWNVVSEYPSEEKDYICTVREYKETLAKQELIKLIDSVCTDDTTSLANAIIRNGWVKKQ